MTVSFLKVVPQHKNPSCIENQNNIGYLLDGTTISIGDGSSKIYSST